MAQRPLVEPFPPLARQPRAMNAIADKLFNETAPPDAGRRA